MSLRLASLAQDLFDGYLFGQEHTVPSTTSALLCTGGGRSLSVNDAFPRTKRTSFAPKDAFADSADDGNKADADTADGAKKGGRGGDNAKADAGGADNEGVGGAGDKEEVATKDDGTDQTDAKSVKVEEKGIKTFL